MDPLTDNFLPLTCLFLFHSQTLSWSSSHPGSAIFLASPLQSSLSQRPSPCGGHDVFLWHPCSSLLNLTPLKGMLFLGIGPLIKWGQGERERHRRAGGESAESQAREESGPLLAKPGGRNAKCLNLSPKTLNGADWDGRPVKGFKHITWQAVSKVLKVETPQVRWPQKEANNTQTQTSPPSSEVVMF